MRTTFAHLPADKQKELKVIQAVIVEMTKPEMVVLFGSYARGDYVNDRYSENGITFTYTSDIDILVVLDNEYRIKPSIEGKIKRKCKTQLLKSPPINVIFHSIDFVNKELEEGNYFFIDIKKEGIILYDSKKFVLSEIRSLSPEEAGRKANEHFIFWFTSANQFYEFFKIAFDKNYVGKAAFELHQSAERYLVTNLLVFTCYKPKTHDLSVLYHDVCRLNNKFRQVFPGKSNEESRLFNILQKAYSDARHKIDYVVSPDDLMKLAEKIDVLKSLTEMICNEKINQIRLM